VFHIKQEQAMKSYQLSVNMPYWNTKCNLMLIVNFGS